MSTLDDAKDSLKYCKDALQQHLDEVSADGSLDTETLKKRKIYFEWIAKKTELVQSEDSFVLPSAVIPSKVSEYLYNYLSCRNDKKVVMDKYYKKDNETCDYLLSVSRATVPQDEVDMLVHNLVLRRGHVVWVHFGFNICG